jgi:hypothetical protein
MGPERPDEVYLWVAAEHGASVVVAADESTWPLVRVRCGGADALVTASTAEAVACALLEAAQACEPVRVEPAGL